jgi:2-dehydro-3-deoxyphosphogluconate aldolase / (4S)-4-hydroxy-2-oxoglutarate aldolase
MHPSPDFLALLTRQRIVPVVTIPRIEDALPLAESLLAGGIEIIEVTLRTPAALAAITQIRQALPTMNVGAGTLTTAVHFTQCRDAGAQFLVSPGASDSLVEAAQAVGLPWLPGVMTPSELIRLLPHGLALFKLFPAQQAGGLGMLETLASVFPDIRFCPTGGIQEATAASFLALPNVIALGGSWMVPLDAVKAHDRPQLIALAKAASAIARGLVEA